MFEVAPRKGGERGEEPLGPPKKRASGKWDGVSRWLHFSRCRAFARSLKLKSLKEWQAWCKVPGQRPVDVPSCPNVVYAGVHGWKGYRDFLGNDFKPFDEARAFARGLKVSSKKEWWAWSKKHRPSDIPSNPYKIYKKAGWTNWGDFLGTGNQKYGSFKPFDEARAFVRGLKLSSQVEWNAWRKKHRPSDIPSSPDRTYKKAGWINWGDFLGTGNKKSGDVDFKPFDEARAFARGLKLSSKKEWRAWRKKHRPRDIPSAPDKTYKEAGWTNWGDFLGTGNQINGRRNFKPFDEARAFARGLKLSSMKEWQVWSNKHRPSDIPSRPDKTYKEAGWTNWGDFLGTGNKRNGYKYT